MQKVKFTRMEDGTAEEYAFLERLEDEYRSGLADRLMQALARLEHGLSGYQVSRLEHSLQAATRAYEAGESDEWIVAALLHDIGDELAPCSHSEMAAAVLRPFVSDEVYWVVKHHGIFQLYYYAHHHGGDRNAREQFRGHEYFESAVKFCARYDQNSFDPAYRSKPLEFFRPFVERIVNTPSQFQPEGENADAQ